MSVTAETIETVETPDSLMGETFGVDLTHFAEQRAEVYDISTHRLAGEGYKGTLNDESREKGTLLRLPIDAAQVVTVTPHETPNQVNIEFNEEVSGEIEVRTKEKGKNKVIILAITGTSFAVSAAAFGAYLARAHKKAHV